MHSVKTCQFPRIISCKILAGMHNVLKGSKKMDNDKVARIQQHTKHKNIVCSGATGE